MQIHIKGKFKRANRWPFKADCPWIDEGFVFVAYLNEDIFLGDVFELEDGTEITLREIKLQFDTKEPLTSMGAGWKCLCRFENLNLDPIPVVRDWFSDIDIPATRKTSPV